jgi:CHAT domain-containing protein
MKKFSLQIGITLATLATTSLVSLNVQAVNFPVHLAGYLRVEKLTAQASNIEELWQQVHELRATGQYQEAIAILDQIVQLQPDSVLAWYWRGNSLSRLGEYETAIASYQQAIQLEPEYLVARFEQGNTFYNWQKYDEAIAAWQQALSVQGTSDYEQQLLNLIIPQRIAQVLLYNQQQPEAAIPFYNQILDLKPNSAELWIDRGIAFYQLSQYEAAIADFSQAIQLDENNAQAWTLQGFALYRLERYDQAIAALEMAEGLDPQTIEVSALLEILKSVNDSRAELQILQQRFANLRQLISTAEERLMNLRAETQSATEQLEATQAQLRQSQQRLAAIESEIAAAQKRLEDLQAQARQSQEQVAGDREERQRIQSQLDALQAERQRLEQEWVSGLENLPSLPVETGLARFQQELQTLQQVARQEFGFTNAFEDYLGIENVPIKPLSVILSDLRQIEQNTSAKPAIVYSFLGSQSGTAGTKLGNKQTDFQNPPETDDDPLELVVVTADGRTIRKRIEGVTRSQIRQMTELFFRNVTNVRNPTGYLEPAQKLYEWLVAPLEEAFQGQQINNLTFLMDKTLRSVPIAALHDGQGFLAERYSLGIMPSLALTDTSYGVLKNTQVLAMGAERFPDQPPLPAVPIELETITDRLWLGQSFLNEAFTVENLKQARAQEPYGIVHLATHAEFKPGQLSNSYIELWGGKRLRLNQLRQLQLNQPPVDLLVLSACRTALGNDEAELGFAGLAIQAGVKSAMGSLWYVSDAGTLALMTAFYRKLKEVPTKAEALRLAQVAMIRGDVRIEGGQLVVENERIPLPPELAKLGDRTFSHPYYWSAFTMIGNPW